MSDKKKVEAESVDYAQFQEVQQEEARVDLYSSAKYPIPLSYGPDGKESVTVPPRGKLRGLLRSQLPHPLPAGLTVQVVA